jgi:hypothetical protein
VPGLEDDARGALAELIEQQVVAQQQRSPLAGAQRGGLKLREPPLADQLGRQGLSIARALAGRQDLIECGDFVVRPDAALGQRLEQLGACHGHGDAPDRWVEPVTVSPPAQRRVSGTAARDSSLRSE